MIIIVTILIILIFLFFGINKTDSRIKKINKKMDKQHTKILNDIDILKKDVLEHWEYENKLHEIGLEKMPPNHKNITKEWISHQREHKNFVKNISELKNKLITHINVTDTKDFHWTN